MRIRVKPSRRRLDRVSLNLASMIDVVFLLLIYLIITMVIRAEEDHLSPTLQTRREAGSGAISDFQPQIIDVLPLDGAPAYRLGSRVMTGRADLAVAIQELPRSVGVIVRVYEGVPVGFAVAALQLAHDAGFEQVTYVAAEGKQ